MVIEQKKGVPTAISWFLKTRAIGLIFIFFWVLIFLIIFIPLGFIFENTYIVFILSLIISLAISGIALVKLNKRYVKEWKVAKSKKNIKRSKVVSIIFVTLFILLVLLGFIGPIFFQNETLDRIRNSPILSIVVIILFAIFAYYRFIKKE